METHWGGQRAVFTLMWEKARFPSEMDLAFMTDFMNADWVRGIGAESDQAPT